MVGDFSQSIYSWRGAEIRNLEKIQTDFPRTVVFHLEQNYRSTQNILNFAYDIISKNQSHPVLKLFTDNDSVIIPDLASMADFEPLNLALSQVVISEGSKNLFLEPKNEAEEPMSFSSFASKFLTNPNQSLLGNITDKRFGLVISRQQEKFDSLGEPVLEAESETRTALIVEVTDVTIAKTAMSEWEQTLPEALLDFFQITDESDQIAFDDNSYRDVSIRFMNFPSPDRSIDYAFVSSATGNTYLVVANSREQIYSIIDTLLGF